MRKGLRWKVVVTLAVLVLALVVSYPITKKIKLGLDLKGGIHLVLQVMTDDAVNMETDQEILRLQELFKKNNITFASMARGEPGQFNVQGINPEQEGQVKDQLEQMGDWDYSLSGTTSTATYKAAAIQAIRDQAVEQSVETIRNRVDQFGVAEPIIQRQGTSRIIVELPGVDNPERVQNIIKTTALLEWKMVQSGPAPDEATLLKDSGGKVADNQEVVTVAAKARESEGGTFYLLDRVAVVTGKDLRIVRRTIDEWNNPAVSFGLKADGARRFESATGQNIGRRLAIVLDGKVQSAPVINARISDEGIITGHFTLEQAEDLVVVLKAGALPAGLKTLENRTIGPSLGADSIRAGLLAGLIAIVSVMAFMIIYYKLSGLNAVAAMILNVIILFGSLAYFRATLTLPGIAGIILGLGMAVDANVLIFERIREEHALGKGVLSSISLGFSRAFSAIFDSNLTTIISAIFLFQFGTGPIKGYAVTLIISLVANLFTAVFVSHVIFDLTHNKNSKKLSI
ncbi:MAG: protein translocase subunit SecD [Candidatus Aminicenantes bacterium]|nr:protein translocase subunit SecD [Candidatus Aminicenantes bacterium]